MYSRYILMLVILMQLSAFVYADCVGYNDTFSVRVLDAKLRPLEGAGVTVTFDRGTTFGQQYYITPVRITDSTGMLSYTINNQGTTSRVIDCAITINATLDNETQIVIVQANQHGPTIDVDLPTVFPVNFYVWDQYDVPLPNATVEILNKTSETDSNGLIKYYFPSGVYDYVASYIDAVDSNTLNITGDTNYKVIFPYYPIQIQVIDDTGTPLNATLTIFNQTTTMNNGVYNYPKAFGQAVPYTVEYQGVQEQGTLIPATNATAQIIYDVHSPVFGQITPEQANGRTRLQIIVSDPGQFASGVDPTSIHTQFRVEPSDTTTPWNDAVTFTAGKNQFTSDFPQLPPNSIVDFKIQVKDYAGNLASIDGKFTTFSESNPQNTTQNQTNTQQPPTQQQGIPLLYIMGGVIIVILAIFVVFRIKSKASGGS